MSDRKIRGQAVSEEQIQAWAEEAEAGYDVTKLRNRGGHPQRPGSGETHDLGLT